MAAEPDVYKAVVKKVVENGPRGPYAVASSEVIQSITFSLNPPVWQEKDLPEPGIYVILSDVRKKTAGWRATKSRFFKPSDEQ